MLHTTKESMPILIGLSIIMATWGAYFDEINNYLIIKRKLLVRSCEEFIWELLYKIQNTKQKKHFHFPSLSVYKINTNRKVY